jgi:hypothetical protein
VTQPAQPTTAQVDDQAAESLAYERAAEGAVVAAMAVEVGTALATIWAAFEALEAAGHAATEIDRLISELIGYRLGLIDPDLRPDLNREVRKGLAMGARHAYDLAGYRRADRARAVFADDTALRHVVDRADERARRRLDEATAIAHNTSMADRQNVTTVLGKARSAVGVAEADTRWVANRALNAGTAAVAKEQGWLLIWVAERDACLHCLAYSGRVTTPGVPFPAGLTFAAKALRSGYPLLYPPLHPNCRCRVIPWDGSADHPAPGIALAREAQRSVVRGDSAFASEPARLAAADRLIQRGAQLLPRSVAARGSRAVARGRFETQAERRARR